MQVDMRAGLVGRQRAAVDAAELEQAGVARRIADRGQADLDQGVGRCAAACEVAVTVSTVCVSPRRRARSCRRIDRRPAHAPFATCGLDAQLAPVRHVMAVWSAPVRAMQGAERCCIDAIPTQPLRPRCSPRLRSSLGAAPAPSAGRTPGSIRRCSPPPRRRARSRSIPRPTSRRACRCSRFSRRRPASSSTTSAATTPRCCRGSRSRRAPGQPSFDIIHITSAHKMPQNLLAQFDPPEAKNIIPEARDPNRRWYGVYTIYHDAGLQHRRVIKPSELPKSFRGVRHAQGMGRQGRHRPHRHRMAARHAAVLRRAEGHRAGARDRRQSQAGADRRTARHGALGGGRRVSVRAQQFRQSHAQREARRRPDRLLSARSGAALLRAGGGQRQGAESERGAARRQLHAEPGMPAVLHEIRAAADPHRRRDQSARHRRAGYDPQGRTHAVLARGEKAPPAHTRFSDSDGSSRR